MAVGQSFELKLTPMLQAPVLQQGLSYVYAFCLDARIIASSKNTLYTGFDKTVLGDNVTCRI
ncbi:hypothetical protein [Nostoc commune]|uniref:hypothetical protein n=1 Tax=Nostoc commune TaxID=1178 RepID=UPI0018C691D9|nr:hypothetical protein [Nostoc commune]MBG1258607.1 hypothetical protein [Nostoc commune BAE]